MKTISVKDLDLGDVISLFDGEYSTAVIIKADEKQVTAFRPYGATSDSSYSFGLIPYTGSEQVTYLREFEKEFPLYRKGNVK